MTIFNRIGENDTDDLHKSKGTGEERSARLSGLASVAFFMSAIALINPALAEECSDMVEMVRSAARDDSLPRDRMHTLELSIDKAIDLKERDPDNYESMRRASREHVIHNRDWANILESLL